MHISCKSCTKNEAFLARYEKSCKNLARKICKIIFLQDFDQILQENYLTIFSCKILARFFISCKKSLIFSARLARYVQDLVQELASFARKIFARFAYFLQDGFYWDVYDPDKNALARNIARIFNKRSFSLVFLQGLAISCGILQVSCRNLVAL